MEDLDKKPENESEEEPTEESSEFEDDSDGREMHKATCAECKQECEVPFKPTEDRPVYCKDCYAARRPRRSNNNNFRSRDRFNSRPREMHKATCAECKQECEVPFKPTEGKPVFCRDCYSKRDRDNDF